MGAGDLEARLVLRDEQLQRTLRNVETTVERASGKNAAAAADGNSMFGRSLKSVAAIALSIGTIKKGWDFAAQSLQRYAEQDRQTANNLDRVEQSWGRLQTTFGGGIALAFNQAIDGVVDFIGWIEKAHAKVTDLAATAMRVLMEDEGWSEAASNIQSVNEGKRRKEEEKKLDEQQKRYAAMGMNLRAEMAEVAGNSFEADVLRATAKLESTLRDLDKETKSGGITRQQRDSLAAQAERIAEESRRRAGSRINERAAKDDSAARKERLDSEMKVRLRRQEAQLEIGGVQAAMARLAGETKLADIMEIRLKTQEKLQRIWNDDSLSRLDKMDLAMLYKAQQSAEIASLGAITGGRGQVGLSGSTFAQAQASSANRQTDLLKSNNDQLKAVRQAIEKLSNSGLVGVYGP